METGRARPEWAVCDRAGYYLYVLVMMTLMTVMCLYAFRATLDLGLGGRTCDLLCRERCEWL